MFFNFLSFVGFVYHVLFSRFALIFFFLWVHPVLFLTSSIMLNLSSSFLFMNSFKAINSRLSFASPKFHKSWSFHCDWFPLIHELFRITSSFQTKFLKIIFSLCCMGFFGIVETCFVTTNIYKSILYLFFCYGQNLL